MKEVDRFYARLARELVGCDPNQPSRKRKANEQSTILKAVLQEQAAQRKMLERMMVHNWVSKNEN